MAAWVHNVLTDSFLVAYEAYGREPVTTAEADRFVVEQAEIGALHAAAPLPETAAAVSSWIADNPNLASSAAQANALGFLCNSPLPAGAKLGYRTLFETGRSHHQPEERSVLGLHARRGGERVGRATVRALRWSLGSSPSSHLALVRCGAPVPPGLFRPTATRTMLPTRPVLLTPRVSEAPVVQQQ